MKLQKEALKDRAVWENAGFKLPEYDIDAMRAQTEDTPEWVHLGAGNIFRAFICKKQQMLLDSGDAKTGIIAVEGFDYDIVTKIYKPFDELCAAVTLKVDGSTDQDIIASVAKSLILDPENEDWADLLKIFRSPTLKMVSFTITEKGYSLLDRSGNIAAPVAQDMKEGPAKPVSYLGKVTALLYERFKAGELPVAMVSMDNCSHNGELLEKAVTAFVKAWVENGKAEPEFLAYVTESGKVSFPWSMIDKITPRPDASVQKSLEERGLEDIAPIITSRNTYIAPYVNAEEAEYLVIEDKFPNGRPALEKVGIYFTDRETVNKTEKMKVGTCLNPIHTALAIYGCLLGHKFICDETRDPQLKALATELAMTEGMPAVVDPGILSPVAFATEVLEKRLPNPFMPDTPQRIVTDTSQKLPVRFGETIKTYIAREDLKLEDLKLIPLVFAGWCRYLMGIDDEGKAMELSSDPLLAELTPVFENVKLGGECDVHALLAPILANARIFGVDLYEVGMAPQVEAYFAQLIAGPGAVRETLKKAVG